MGPPDLFCPRPLPLRLRSGAIPIVCRSYVLPRKRVLEELKEVYKLGIRLSDFFSSLITEQSIWPLALHFDTLGPLPFGGMATQCGLPPPIPHPHPRAGRSAATGTSCGRKADGQELSVYSLAEAVGPVAVSFHRPARGSGFEPWLWRSFAKGPRAFSLQPQSSAFLSRQWGTQDRAMRRQSCGRRRY